MFRVKWGGGGFIVAQVTIVWALLSRGPLDNQEKGIKIRKTESGEGGKIN